MESTQADVELLVASAVTLATWFRASANMDKKRKRGKVRVKPWLTRKSENVSSNIIKVMCLEDACGLKSQKGLEDLKKNSVTSYYETGNFN